MKTYSTLKATDINGLSDHPTANEFVSANFKLRMIRKQARHAENCLRAAMAALQPSDFAALPAGWNVTLTTQQHSAEQHARRKLSAVTIEGKAQ